MHFTLAFYSEGTNFALRLFSVGKLILKVSGDESVRPRQTDTHLAGGNSQIVRLNGPPVAGWSFERKKERNSGEFCISSGERGYACSRFVDFRRSPTIRKANSDDRFDNRSNEPLNICCCIYIGCFGVPREARFSKNVRARLNIMHACMLRKQGVASAH